jgi:hypothetical protein
MKKKIKEYKKKKKRDTSLEFLEFSSFSKSKKNNNKKSDKKQEPLLFIDPRLNDKFMLLILPKPPLLYNDCRYY